MANYRVGYQRVVGDYALIVAPGKIAGLKPVPNYLSRARDPIKATQ
jgi:hypothetical protein